MPISLKETLAIEDMAQLLYDFLPAKPHPYGDQKVSFEACSISCGIGKFYPGGSKKPAISGLLTNTLEHARGSFCKLMFTIIQTGIGYRSRKGNPISREEIEALNDKIKDVGFKIPALWNPEFLRSLPSSKPAPEPVTSETDQEKIDKLKAEFIGLESMDPHQRGYAFQDFLGRLFNAFGLNPKKSFRITGEEIDGSFEIGNDTYLLEAKWQAKQTSQADLLVFSGKVGGKAAWSRGLFISYAGFTTDGLEAFKVGKATNMIGMDSIDIYFILDGQMSFRKAITEKARVAAETNSFFTSVHALANH